MLVRILTALVTIPFFLGLLYTGQWPLFALVAGMGLLGFREYAQMWRMKGVHVAYGLGSLSCLAFQVWAYMTPENGLLLGALFTALSVAMLVWHLVWHHRRTIVDAAVSIAGVIYVGWLLSHLLLLRGMDGGQGWDAGFRWIGMAFFCTWAADSCAYFAGRAFGRRKLVPTISPGKTWEGVAGGSAGALTVGMLWSTVLGIAEWQGGLIGLLISVVAVVGDLAESALKRYTGVKDSGRLLPGHGGMLDRFDSSLFVLPFVYYIAKIFFAGQGSPMP